MSVHVSTCTSAIFSEAYEGEAMEKSTVFEWHKLFKEGSENVEDDARSGRPSKISQNR
jgi:transposase